MDTMVQQAEVKQVVIPPPPLYVILLFDDNITPMDFVAVLLMQVFDMDPEQAKSTMLYIHEHGQGVVGRWVKDIADIKMMEAGKIITDSGFPLVIKMEKDI